MIHAHADDLFHGMRVKGYQFRLTRNADLSVDTEDVETWPALRGELISRRYGDAVRLEVADTCPQHLADFLLKQFNLGESEMYRVNGPVSLTRLFSITGLDSHPELQQPVHAVDSPTAAEQRQDLQRDQQAGHPAAASFESFTPVVDLLREAARTLRAGDQTDAVSLRRQFRDRRCAGRRGAAARKSPR